MTTAPPQREAHTPNAEHFKILKKGVEIWNKWRKEYRIFTPDLSGARLNGTDLSNARLNGANLSYARLNDADLSGADLSKSDLSGASLRGAYLSNANLIGTNLCNADLGGAYFWDADLCKADLSGANLRGAYLIGADLNATDLSNTDLTNANLSGANLTHTILYDADLTGADLTAASLVKTNFSKAVINDCRIFGVSAWGLVLEGTEQKNLVITDYDEPVITVDDLEVAQFIYILLNNPKIREVLDTVTSKAVLILGRFTPERKAILDALRNNLRQRGYLPIIFDFDKPSTRNLTETVSTLAHMARFVIADITDPKSIPQELQRIVPDLPSVPIQPLVHSSSTEYAMFQDYSDYQTVLPLHRYDGLDELLESLEGKVILPAENMAKAIEARRKAFEQGGK